MDYTVLSNWHSVSHGESSLLSGAIVMADGLKVEVYTSNEGLYFSIKMPSQHLRFYGLFKDHRGHYLVLEEDGQRLYWRSLSNQEYKIIQLWWQQLPERQVFEDELLTRVKLFLLYRQEQGHRLMITLRTRHGRFVMLTQGQCHAFHRDTWRAVDNPQIIARFLTDGTAFWVHREQYFAEGPPMSRKTFLAYINPVQRRAG